MRVPNILFIFLLSAWPLWSAAQQGAVPITVTQAVVRDLPVLLEVPGDLESKAQPMLAAETGGRVLRLGADEGDTVQAGQLLAEFDAEAHQIALEKEQAEQQRLQALLQNQRLTLKRYENLVQHSSSAQSDLDKARTDLAVLQAELAGAAARIKDARYRLSKTRLETPVGGVVQRRMVSVGDYVQVGAPLFQLVSTDPLRARLNFPETSAPLLRPGLVVELRLPGRDAAPLTTQLSYLLPGLNPANRALQAVAEFPNPGGWRPGSSVVAVVTVETRAAALLIPEGALVRRPAGSVVYRIVDNTARQQIVETGLRDGDLIEIRNGLAAGDTIALDGAGFLTDGAAVVVK